MAIGQWLGYAVTLSLFFASSLVLGQTRAQLDTSDIHVRLERLSKPDNLKDFLTLVEHEMNDIKLKPLTWNKRIRQTVSVSIGSSFSATDLSHYAPSVLPSVNASSIVSPILDSAIFDSAIFDSATVDSFSISPSSDSTQLNSAVGQSLRFDTVITFGGLVEARRPPVKAEHLYVLATYDDTDRQQPSTLYAIAATLELAEYLKSMETKLGRSVVIAIASRKSLETGLFFKYPFTDTRFTAAAVIVGGAMPTRGDSVEVSGIGSSSYWQPTLDAFAVEIALSTKRSLDDEAAHRFYDLGVPVVQVGAKPSGDANAPELHSITALDLAATLLFDLSGLEHLPVTTDWLTAIEPIGFEATDKQKLVVKYVTPGSTAAEAGLRPDDTILSVDGHALRTRDALNNRLRLSQPGDRIQLRVQRAGADSTVSTVELLVRPPKGGK